MKNKNLFEMIAYFLFVSFVTVLVACSPEESIDSRDSSSSRHTSSSSTSAGTIGGTGTDIEEGKKIFDAQCAQCHDATFKSLGQKLNRDGHDIASLTQAITLSMPVGKAEPSDCVDECAELTAKYIASVNPFFGVPYSNKPTADIDAAPVTMSRLTAVEYNNTVRDLMGTSLQPADLFPADFPRAFDNDSLIISPLHMEGYYKAAISLASEAIESAKGGARSVINCDFESPKCAQIVIQEFGFKAWRRPVTSAESILLMAFYDSVQLSSGDRAVSMQTLIHRILLSPNFIFRPEFDVDLASTVVRELSGYELASRLSYFLWSSMPDERLFAKAADGSLNRDKTLQVEVARMLDSPKAGALIDNFAVPWLGFADLEYKDSAKILFRDVSQTLVTDFISESKSFIEYIFQNNRPVSDIIAADYTFLNGPLAAHYGVSGFDGEAMEIHHWGEGSNRRGILGHASILTRFSYSSYSFETSPVKRGLWVADRLLCARPPEESSTVVDSYPELPDGLNSREFLEMSVNSLPICGSCHTPMDSFGYGLENFDPIGLWRETYSNGDVVDASAQLQTGESFSGLVELSSVLAKNPDTVLCTIQNAMSYALGRRLNPLAYSARSIASERDYAAVYSVYKRTENSGHGLRDIITQIVLSPVFRSRRGADSKIGE